MLRYFLVARACTYRQSWQHAQPARFSGLRSHREDHFPCRFRATAIQMVLIPNVRRGRIAARRFFKLSEEHLNGFVIV
jgi:hypothetical protein